MNALGLSVLILSHFVPMCAAMTLVSDGMAWLAWAVAAVASVAAPRLMLRYAARSLQTVEIRTEYARRLDPFRLGAGLVICAASLFECTDPADRVPAAGRVIAFGLLRAPVATVVALGRGWYLQVSP